MHSIGESHQWEGELLEQLLLLYPVFAAFFFRLKVVLQAGAGGPLCEYNHLSQLPVHRTFSLPCFSGTRDEKELLSWWLPQGTYPLANSLTWHTPSQIAPAVKCSSYYNEDYMILPCQEDSWERGFKTREMGNENTLNWAIADCDAVSPQCTVSTLKWNTPCGIFFCVWMNGKEKVAENGSLVFGMTKPDDISDCTLLSLL